MACPSGCIFTLVAFFCLFSTVYFQMCPQSTCLRACILTLVAFVWFYSSVCFYVILQVACICGWIFTLVAFVDLFTTIWLHLMIEQHCSMKAHFLLCLKLCFFLPKSQPFTNDNPSLCNGWLKLKKKMKHCEFVCFGKCFKSESEILNTKMAQTNY